MRLTSVTRAVVAGATGGAGGAISVTAWQFHGSSERHWFQLQFWQTGSSRWNHVVSSVFQVAYQSVNRLAPDVTLCPGGTFGSWFQGSRGIIVKGWHLFSGTKVRSSFAHGRCAPTQCCAPGPFAHALTKSYSHTCVISCLNVVSQPMNVFARRAVQDRPARESRHSLYQGVRA